MTEREGFSRRGFMAGVALLGLPALAPPAGAAPSNGWRPVSAGAVELCQVEGSAAAVHLLRGDVAVVLTHVLRRLHYEVLPLGRGDVLGHLTSMTAVGPGHDTGTVIAVRPDRFPLGLTGGLHDAEVAVVRDILADCEGTVRWGADEPEVLQEGRFRIEVQPGDKTLARVARALRDRDRPPGTRPDPFEVVRRARANRLAQRQRRR